MSIILKAKELRHNNRVKMQVDGTLVPTSLFFPVENPMPVVTTGKIRMTIQKNTFDFDAEQQFIVDPRFLYAEQLRQLTGVTKIDFVDQERPAGQRTVVRRYIGESHQQGNIILERNMDRKTFSIVMWPSWMPQMTPELKRDLELARSWKNIERVMYAYTGASVTGAPAPAAKKSRRKRRSTASPDDAMGNSEEVDLNPEDEEKHVDAVRPASQIKIVGHTPTPNDEAELEIQQIEGGQL
jgi:hypothetical protein